MGIRSYFFNILTSYLKNKNNTFLLAFITNLLKHKCNAVISQNALKLLFELENNIYTLLGQQSIRYGKGIHTKHRHINYHKFFTDNLIQGENVLDIGSCTGELAFDIALKIQPGKILGVEIENDRVLRAQTKYEAENLEFICADATQFNPDIKVDVITMSNVLEHIEFRVEFLKKLKEIYNPNRFLIRVPVFERDWRVPLKKELGIDYFLDKTHFIEFTNEEFESEISLAGLEIQSAIFNWGEIWAVIK